MSGGCKIRIISKKYNGHKRNSSSRRAVAVEVDGPSHYSSNPPFRELGHTLLRRRLLGPRVDAVLSIPFYEWDELGGIPGAEEEYIERKIRAALLH